MARQLQSSNVHGIYGCFCASEVPVRQSIDIDRNNYAATVSYRPTRRLTLKGDYEREETDRNHTGHQLSSIHFVGARQTHTGTYRVTKRSTGSG